MSEQTNSTSTAYPVNLPQTSFSMRAQLAQNEPRWLQFWQEQHVYDGAKGAAAERFILHDGPPYANGNIHIGHAFNKIAKDIINKTQLLEGRAINLVPGWDCHGLPIELQVEKKLGRVGAKVSKEEFIAGCKQYAKQQIDLQRASFKRLGILADWDHPYITMDNSYEARVAEVFSKILAKGYIVRGYKPVYWCSACGSALAEAEVEYLPKKSTAIDVCFKIADLGRRFHVEPNEAVAVDKLLTGAIIPIWTTTPWTIPANQAVALNPEGEYQIVEVADGRRFLLLKELTESALQRWKLDKWQVLSVVPGRYLEGALLQHPIEDRRVPVVLGAYVTSEAGTGAVHTAPAHGLDDYWVGVKYHLPCETPVNAKGRFEASDWQGASWPWDQHNLIEGGALIIEQLAKNGNLLASQEIEHSYPHCWRHKTPLIFRATTQWFISLDKVSEATGKSLRQAALDSLDSVQWLPASGKNSMRSMLAQRPDWCISRQRVYGSPIPLLIHETSHEIHPAMQELLERWIVPGIEREGILFWHKLDAQQFLTEHQLDASGYQKVTDTLDVWFDSGASSYAVLQARGELGFPAQLYLEGMDQYRGWFQASLLISLMLNQRPPFEAVLAHGFTIDANGHKMSKSLGNVIDPQEVVQKFGADILRLWTGNNYLYDDVAISPEILARTVDHYRALRNGIRFMLGNLAGLAPGALMLPSQLLPLDRYVVWRVARAMQQSREQYASFTYYLVGNGVLKLLTGLLSGFYFSVIKDRLYTAAKDSVARVSAQSALFYLLQLLLRVLAPVISFTVEEAWQALRELEIGAALPKSVFQARWSDLGALWELELNGRDASVAGPTEAEWDGLLKCRELVNKALEEARSGGTIGSSLDADVELAAGGVLSGTLKRWAKELKWLFIVSNCVVTQQVASKQPDAGVVVLQETIEQETVTVTVAMSPHPKCSRCWHHQESVGQRAEHPTLCERCYNNLFGPAETRLF